MPRVKRGVQARARHKSVMKAAKGYKGRRSTTFRAANQAVMKAGQYQYRDRRVRKREFRRLWITRINAGAQEHGLNYSRFIYALNGAGIEVDRKMLAEMAVNDKAAFAKLADIAKSQLGA